MAGLAHVGVGLAAKRFAPKVPVGVLLLGAYVIDIVWGVFFVAGVEHFGVTTTNPWSHGLFMAVVWSGVAALIAQRCCHNLRTSVIIGLLVFSHWVVDFMRTSQMRYAKGVFENTNNPNIVTVVVCTRPVNIWYHIKN